MAKFRRLLSSVFGALLCCIRRPAKATETAHTKYDIDKGTSPQPTSVKDSLLQLRDHIDDQELPGLRKLIDDWFDPKTDVDEEQFARRFLHVFKQSDEDFTYEKVIGDYDEGEQEIFNDFVDGKITAEEAAKRYSPFQNLRLPMAYRSFDRGGHVNLIRSERNIQDEHEALLQSLPEDVDAHVKSLVARAFPVLKDPKDAIYVPTFKNLEFQNWGRTVENTPAITCVPETTSDVQEIVKYAKANNKGVRVSGFRHSWSPIFGRNNGKRQKNNGDILISTLGLVDASILPNFTSLPTDLFQPHAKDLNSILVVDEKFVNGPKLDGGKKYVRVGCSTTNEQLRRWCIETGNVTLPMNIIEVEITMGGSNATICHGAGIKNKTLSDLVRSLEYVDANGEARKVDMSTPDLVKAASGCFGLIGVVTHLTLEFDPMSCALMEPRKLPVVEAVPPPPELNYEDIPLPLRPEKPLTVAQRKRYQEDFEKRANTSDYAEWFWFPYSQESWVNTWKKTSSLEGAQAYPSDAKTILQVFGTIMMNIAQNAVSLARASEFLPEKQTQFLSEEPPEDRWRRSWLTDIHLAWLAMQNLDDIGENGSPIKTWLPDALHFQRGVQNIRVRDLEVEIPLQPKRDQPKQRDLTTVQRAWWDAILQCYAHMDTCPQRMPLEMRIMGDSEVTLSPQRHNIFGTCSMEILTLHDATDIWQPYAQTVLDKWTSYKDAAGRPLNIRPHWAKEWFGYRVGGVLWQDKLRTETYRDEIKEFMQLLQKIGAKHGWTLADIKRRFSNELLDMMFFQ